MIKIYDTLTRKKKKFTPVKQGKVGIYACGTTPYKLPHLGHAMQAILFDIVRRYFEYKGLEVTYVRNYTDVDDKIISEANRLEINALELSSRIIKESDEAFDLLRVRRADYEPKVSECIDSIIKMTQLLIEKNFAYATKKGNVYFRVKKFKSYGKLSNQKIDKLRHGTRKDIEPDKEDTLDFALWKSSKPKEIFWESPWGKGRPGWHIECSVMSLKNLGKQFDIHGGGADLIFPHHENEIAQSEAANDGVFANYWMHNGLLMVGKEKMSKSLNNDTSISDWLKKFHPEVIRYLIVSNHYRSHIQFVPERYVTANKKVYQVYKTIHENNVSSSKIDKGEMEKLILEFEKYMDDDLNTVRVIAMIHGLVKKINTLDSKDKIQTATYIMFIQKVGGIIGLFDLDPKKTLKAIEHIELKRRGIDEEYIQNILKAIDNHRNNKEYEKSDELRVELTKKGVKTLNKGNKSSWEVIFE